MTDRELLEAAAKAAGISYQITNDGRFSLPVRSDGSIYWNPLTDDGDALRLAVKLCIDLQNVYNAGGVFVSIIAHPARRGECDAEEPFALDPYAATRRAVVRSAAEIGSL